MQTAPLVSAVKANDPQSEVHLLIDQTQLPIAEMIDRVDEIHTFDRTALSKELAGNQLTTAFRRTAEFTRQLNRTPLDSVVNITHTPESGYLTSLINAKQHFGVIGRRNAS